jgi:peptidoglycan/LPS O-acetylase OafA/YrhL
MVWRCWLVWSRRVDGVWAYNAFDCRFDNLLVGCLLAFVGERERLQPVFRTLVVWWWTPLLTLALILTSRMATPADYHNGPGFTVDAVLLAVLLIQLLQLSASSAWRWLESPVAGYLGRISYPIYLYHLWGLSIGSHVPLLPPSARIAVGVLAGIGLAAGSYHLVELPFLRLKKRFARVREVPQRVGAP